MSVLYQVSVLALRPLVEGACKCVGVDASGATEAVADFLVERFTDHSQRLTRALQEASADAWRAIEIALAGDSWWERVKARLARGEDRALREQIRRFLDATPLGGLPGHGAEFRERCLADLRAARKRGLLEGDLQLGPLARRAGAFARFADPESLLRVEWEILGGLAAEVRAAGLSTLADFLELRPLRDASILVVAVRYFFRRQIETDAPLFQGLAFVQMGRLEQTQEDGFAALGEALAGQGGRLEGLLAEVGEVVRETHGDVKEIRAALARHGQHLQAVGQVVLRALARPAAPAGADAPARQEQDLRLEVLNTLLITPHRRLDLVWPLHQQLIEKDPRFYVRLAAWYHDKGEIRDHKEAFLACLLLGSFPGHRDVGLALMRSLPPYQLVRVVDFIHGRKETRRRYVTQTAEGPKPRPEGPHRPRSAAKKKQTRAEIRAAKKPPRRRRVPVRDVVGDFGLFRNLPGSARTEIVRYLREREANPEWFDSTVLVARKALKRLYALLHVKPGPRAQQILFDDKPPSDSRLHGLRALARCESPEEQARAVVACKVPFRVAVSVLRAITPATLEGLIECMSPQELLNNLGALQRHGALSHPDLRALIDLKLEEARRSARVSAFKAETAMDAVTLDAQLRCKLEELTDAQVKAKGRLRRPTALLIDKSGSMEEAIDVGKRIAAMISAVCEQELYVYAFDTMAYAVASTGRDWAAWKAAFAGINAGGQTSCGVALEVMRRKNQAVRQIIVVTDEEEYDPPFFVESLLKYRQALGVDPDVCFVRVRDSSTRLEDQCKQAGVKVSTFDFAGDYYSLPNLIALLEPPSELDLLTEIMEYPLPERRPAS